MNIKKLYGITGQLILLWVWQDTVTNLTVKTLNYSEFKKHVRSGEVVEAKISPDRIQGKIVLKPGSIARPAGRGDPGRLRADPTQAAMGDHHA